MKTEIKPFHSTIEGALRQAIETHIREVSEEEVDAAIKRIKERIMSDTISLAPQVLKQLSWRDSTTGTVTVQFQVK